jgi:hypothetical protein
MTEGFAGIVDGVGRFIDSLGGIGPTVLILATAFGNTLFPIIQTGIKTASNALSVWTGKAAQDVRNVQNAVSAQMDEMLSKGNFSDTVRQQITVSQDLLKIK